MARRTRKSQLEDNPLWYKDGVIYQLHVRAFFDSNEDGIGDFAGLTQKLDYLQDLGVTALWLLPFYPSPLKDDGYDIAAYTAVHPNYGSIPDFKLFMREAHQRGMRVITELVINHTSDQHAWFQRARTSPPGSKARDYYVWTDDPNKYKETRIIFKDFETSNWTWDPVAKQYFWHRFYHHQPDLNFDNPVVHKAVADVLDFWMDMGVDGLRLDAVPYLYEREGTSCENLPETHEYLKSLRSHLDAKYRNRMLLAEANQWPEDTRPYFGDGDECHVAFHFPLMPRLFMSVAMEDRFPLIDIMQQTPDIPDLCQWALFLRNHDELTLEMVTDEDRDYMYRTYARDRRARINLGIRRRLAPLLENHRPRIELMNALLFSFPGTPIIYYGDEIGMGDNIYLGDRNGVRTPMQWSPDRNAGFSRANPQRLYFPVIIDPEYHYESVNVEAQQNNSHSLLWWMKRLIALRRNYIAFGRGSLEFLHPENRKILAMVRSYEGQSILVIANLSRTVQYAELDLSRYKGIVPIELSGQTRFPVVGDQPYLVTLAPYAFMWLLMSEPERESIDLRSSQRLSAESFEELYETRREELERLLQSYISAKRWFGSKARDISGTEIVESIPLEESHLVMVRISYVEGPPETYMLPVALCWDDDATTLEQQHGHSVIALVDSGRRHGVLYEAVHHASFARAMMTALRGRKTLRGEAGEIEGVRTKLTKEESRLLDPSLQPSVMRAEQSNTSIIFGEKVYVKLFRKLEAGTNPDVEITRFLAEKTNFAGSPKLLGHLQYQADGAAEPVAIGIAQEFVPDARDAWQFTVAELGRFFERVVSDKQRGEELKAHIPTMSAVDLAEADVDPIVVTLLENYVNAAELLGKRTAEMHKSLIAAAGDLDFAPEPFTPHYQRGVYQAMRTQTTRAMQLLRRKSRSLPEKERAEAEKLLTMEPQIQERFRSLIDHNIHTNRIRVHGDFHLGQVLYTGKDFLIIDFEGEPSRPLSERRLKRSALRDVAGMIRSFHYASRAVLMGQVSGTSLRTEDLASLGDAATFWQKWVDAIYLREYVNVAKGSGVIPEDKGQLRILIDAYLLEKALYEIQYELNNRPHWVGIPLRGALDIVEST